jgi:septum formation topological specificity factor MinE
MSDITPIEWVDEAVKVVIRQTLEAGKASEWPQVKQGLREIAFICSRRGISQGQFEGLRKDIIQAIEKFEPFAKSYIEIQERGIQ